MELLVFDQQNRERRRSQWNRNRWSKLDGDENGKKIVINKIQDKIFMKIALFHDVRKDA